MSAVAWSCSRAQSFEECRRQYWYRYHLAPQARSQTATDAARQAYFLKQLTGPDAWAGSVVHRVIEQTLQHWRRGRAFERSDALRLAFNMLEREYERSRHCRERPRDRARETCLDRHYFDGPDAISPMLRDKLSELVSLCVRNFFGAPLSQTIRQLDRSQWLQPERFAAARLPAGEGEEPILVIVRPDFAYREGDRLWILDWKTGKPNRYQEEAQVLCYALYAQEKWEMAIEQVMPAVVRLRPRFQLEPFPHDPDRLTIVRNYIRESHAAMTELLPDPAVDWAPAELFPLTEEAGRCRWCVFREECPGGERVRTESP